MLLLFLMIPKRANVIALGNAFRQIQNTAVAFADAVVAAHCDVAKLRDFLIGTARVLPRLYERAVVEVNGKLVVGAFQNIHFKHQLCGE